MLILVTGGAASGKSAHAGRLLCERAAAGSRLYLATMQPLGEAAHMRMLRHHALRAGKGFETIERYTNLASMILPKMYDGILVECMSNLLANEMFTPGASGIDAVSAILQAIDALYLKQCRNMVIVTNEIFSDAETYSEQTMQYVRMLAEINQALSRKADAFVYVVTGIPVPLKGAHLL